MNARATAIARQEDEIAASRERAIAAKKPKSALRALAERLHVSEEGLQSTLLATSFKGATKEEFMALVITANAYDLNPMLKEIYAFPKKGGGITPMVGLDGWIKLANQHPQFNGIEFDDIVDDKGNVVAIEGVLYRKDRDRPTKMMVRLDEFKVDTNPNWRSRKRHMLWVRCYCHTVRVGLGITGLGIEDDQAAEPTEIRATSVPAKETAAEYLDDSIPALEDRDAKTGEVIDQKDPATGMTEVDEETARALDAAEDPASTITTDDEDAAPDERGTAQAGDAGDSAGQAKVAQQTAQDIDGPFDEKSPSEKVIDDVIDMINAATSMDDMKKVDAKWVKAMAAYDDEVTKDMDARINAKRKAIRDAG